MKKTNKKHFFWSICFSLIMCFTFAISGCNCSGCTDSGSGSSSGSNSDSILGETDTVEITMSESSVQLIVGEYKQLTVTYSKMVDGLALEWQSENLNVATVKNGLIEAIAEGTTTIKAKYGVAEASCEIKVAFGESSPQIKLGTVNKFCVNQGDSYTFSPKVLFNGREFTDGTFTYESSDTSVLTMQNNVLTAIKTGTAQVRIEGSWRGKTIANAPALQTVVDVEITDEIEIRLSGEEQSIPVETITLYTRTEFDGKTYKNTDSFIPVIRKNGEIVPNAVYTVINARPDVVIYEEQNNSVTAVGYGEAVFTVQTTIDGKLHSKTFTVAVLRPEKTIEKDIKYFSTYKGTLKNENTLNEQTVMEHILGNNNVEVVDAYQEGESLNVQNNCIFGVRNNYAESYQTTLTIGTKTEIYHVNAIVYGMYITEPSDLEVFVLNENKKAVNLYVELGKDINAQNYILPESNFKITTKKEADGFTGVFEGNGYSIKGLTLQTNQGLFGAVKNGIIKNVAFTNWSYVSGFSQSSGIFGVYLEKAKLNNVYVKINELPASYQGANGLASYKIIGGSFKCVYLEYTENIGEVSYDNCYSAFGAIMPDDQPTFENCIVVSKAPIGICKTESKRLHVAVATNTGIDFTSALAENIKQGYAVANNVQADTVSVGTVNFRGVRQYDTVVDFQTDIQYTSNILNAFSLEYWTVSENKLLWGKNNSEAVEQGTIRLDLGIAADKYVAGITTLKLKATAGETVNLPTNLTCMGYVFKGWQYMGEMLVNGQIENYDGSAMTVVAIWEKADNVIQTPII